MNESYENTGEEYYFNETMATARNMAERLVAEDELFSQVLCEIRGEPYEPASPELLSQEIIGQTVLFMTQLDDPDRVVTLQESLDMGYSDGGYQRWADYYIAEDDATIDPETVREMMYSFAEEKAARSGMTPEINSQLFNEEVQVVSSLAAELGVQVSDIYADDDLYCEFMRRFSEPEDLADLTARLIDSYSEDLLNSIMLKIIDATIPQEIAELLGEDNVNERIMELQFSPEYQYLIATATEETQEAYKQMFVYNFTRIWGAEKLEELLESDWGEILRPQLPLCQTLVDRLEN